MEVVRHEAVRNYCNSLILCGAQNLPEHDLDRLCLRKVLLPVMCAEREEITIQPEVIERFQVARAPGAHAPSGASAVPLSVSKAVRLKADTTF